MNRGRCFRQSLEMDQRSYSQNCSQNWDIIDLGCILSKILSQQSTLLFLKMVAQKAAQEAVRKLLGSRLTFRALEKPVTIHYKYHSFLGFGGDHTAHYDLCTYNSELLGYPVPVFVLDAFKHPESITINHDIQFGVDGQDFFIVSQDAARRKHGIYQWRFTQAAGGLKGLKSLGVAAEGIFGKIIGSEAGTGPIDLSWIAGDPLRDF